MSLDKTVTLAEAVGHRFDDLFKGDDTATFSSNPDTGDSNKSFESPIRDLKSIVLSIEWEITEPVLDRFDQEVSILMGNYRDNPVLVQFLKILQAVGKYIKNKKAEAHPDSIRLLSSAFNSFESVVLTTKMPKDKQQKLLESAINDFKRLKTQIAAAPTTQESAMEQPVQAPPAMPDRPQPEPEPEPIFTEADEKLTGETTGEEDQTIGEQPEYQGLTPHEAFAVAVEELKNVIKAEFQALRAEIRLWREGQ